MKNDLHTDVKLSAKTLAGLEEVLVQELKALGAKDVEEGKRIVHFVGDMGFLYKANLALRTAIRILMPLRSFTITNQDDFYRKAMEIPWEKWLSPEKTFVVHATVFHSEFDHSLFAAQRLKDAVVDRFRKKGLNRPNVDVRNAEIHIDLHISNNRVTVSLDSSGDALHKRSYRKMAGEAPISEVLAAGMLALSGWDKTTPLLDPMCGSGTFLIEAALMASNLPPSIYREDFAFLHWLDFDPKFFETIRESVLKKAVETRTPIMGRDRDAMMIDKARVNIETALFDDWLTVENRDFFNSKPPFKDGFVIMNPPYDMKISISGMDFYKEIGDTLKRYYKGFTVWIVLGHPEAIKHIGLKPSRKINLYNGKIEVKLVKYEMY